MKWYVIDLWLFIDDCICDLIYSSSQKYNKYKRNQSLSVVSSILYVHGHAFIRCNITGYLLMSRGSKLLNSEHKNTEMNCLDLELEGGVFINKFNNVLSGGHRTTTLRKSHHICVTNISSADNFTHFTGPYGSVLAFNLAHCNGPNIKPTLYMHKPIYALTGPPIYSLRFGEFETDQHRRRSNNSIHSSTMYKNYTSL